MGMDSMSDETAYRKVHDELYGVLQAVSEGYFRGFPRPPESPIERMMIIALVGFSFAVPRYRFEGSPCDVAESEKWPTIHIDTQVPIGKFRADIVATVTLAGRELGKVVVECDGHQFHERTKEQATRDRARDRKMTMDGYKVLRFTGSEIYRSPSEAAGDVHQVCWSLFLDDPAK